jgi:hypothetical protein
MLNALGRYGPLVAAFVVGAGGIASIINPELKPVLDGVLGVFRLVGVAADPGLVGEIGVATASGLLVYGSVRKAINLVRAYFGA